MVAAVRSVAFAPSSSYTVQSARREAQQAEQMARTLQSQAQAAQRNADQEQARADDLSSQSAAADQRASRARTSMAAASEPASRPGGPAPSRGTRAAAGRCDLAGCERARGRCCDCGAFRQRVRLICQPNAWRTL